MGTLVVVLAGTALTALSSTSQTFVVSISEAQPRRAGEAWERQPVYIVCDRRGMMVYRSATDIQHVDAASLVASSSEATLAALADSLASLRQERWPVVFVKPGGVATMRRLQALFRERRVSVGRWAVGEDSTVVVQDLRAAR
jgi:hypothetical protein